MEGAGDFLQRRRLGPCRIFKGCPLLPVHTGGKSVWSNPPDSMRLWSLHQGDACWGSAGTATVVFPHMVVDGNPLWASLLTNKKRSGPIKDPWGTPILILGIGHLHPVSSSRQIGSDPSDNFFSQAEWLTFCLQVPTVNPSKIYVANALSNLSLQYQYTGYSYNLTGVASPF